MEISFVTPAYKPSIIGASFYCQDLASFLRKKGHTVTVYTKQDTGWKERENMDGTEVQRFPVKYLPGKKIYFSRKMIDAVASGGADIIHSHHYGYFPATAGLIAAKKTKRPHVFGPYYHPPVYTLARSVQFSVYNMIAGKPLLKDSDKVLPHTIYEKKKLLEIGGVEDNMEILPNTVSTKIFRKRGNKENLLLFVSSLIKDKGADVAINIAEQLLTERKDLKAVFVGRNDDEDVKKMVKTMNRNSRVKFLEGVNRTQLVELYSRASVVFLPSKYEAFSRVMAEAQSCGTPVVATAVGGLPEVVKDGKTGFVIDYGQWTDMKKKIELLLDDKRINRKMGAEARRHIVRNFETDVVGNKLLKIYRSVT